MTGRFMKKIGNDRTETVKEDRAEVRAEIGAGVGAGVRAGVRAEIGAEIGAGGKRLYRK